MAKRISLNTQIVIGAVLGVAAGFWLKNIPSVPAMERGLFIADLLGAVFVNLLKMVLIPLIFTSIVIGITNLRAHAQMHRVWPITLIYFAFTTVLSVLLGLIAVNIFHPGSGLSLAMFADATANFDVQDMTLGQFLKSFLSGLFVNPIAAMAQGKIVPTVVFAIVLGIGMIALHERTRTILAVLQEIFDVIMYILGWIMRFAPLGIFGLLTELVATQNTQLLQSLGKFVTLVVGTTLLHGIVVLPLILYLVTRTSPLKFFKAMQESLITALSTSSSSATMPVTLRCVEQNLKVDKNIAGFVVPMGTTVNMDGTALYEAMAAIFVANLVGIDLSLGQQMVVFFTAMIAAVGAPGIPSAGMVTMIMVLQSVGLPAEAIAILLPIDRPLDAIRTVVNVEGDAVASMVVQKLSQTQDSGHKTQS